MKIYNDINEYAAARKASGMSSSVALGFFDGVHAGHRAVIAACCEGKAEGVEAVVLTFAESPAAALGFDVPAALTDNAKKAALMADIGADAVIFADFSAIKDMTAEDFARVALCEKLGAVKVTCGYNYRFGKGGSGDTDSLKELCARHGITASVVEPVYIGGEAVSSTRIRGLIAEGDIEGADRLLGWRWGVSGVIEGGNRIGTAMGLPTVNIAIGEGMAIPRLGVYSSVIRLGGREYAGATNIGVHPTVGANSVPLCETFIIGYDGADAYGREAVCELGRFIRPEKRFDSIDELKKQISADIETVKAYSVSDKTL